MCATSIPALSGIELSNTGATPFSALQMNALEALLAEVLARHSIPPERVIGHSDMAPTRKIDPGPRFDWRRLARLGLSVWPEVAPVAPDQVTQAAFDAALTTFGYAPAMPPRRGCAPFATAFARATPVHLMASTSRWPKTLRGAFPLTAALPPPKSRPARMAG